MLAETGRGEMAEDICRRVEEVCFYETCGFFSFFPTPKESRALGPLQAQTLQLGAAHRDTLRSRLNLACLLADKGETAEAERLCRAVVCYPRPLPLA